MKIDFVRKTKSGYKDILIHQHLCGSYIAI